MNPRNIRNFHDDLNSHFPTFSVYYQVIYFYNHANISHWPCNPFLHAKMLHFLLLVYGHISQYSNTNEKHLLKLLFFFFSFLWRCSILCFIHIIISFRASFCYFFSPTNETVWVNVYQFKLQVLTQYLFKSPAFQP